MAFYVLDREGENAPKTPTEHMLYVYMHVGPGARAKIDAAVEAIVIESPANMPAAERAHLAVKSVP